MRTKETKSLSPMADIHCLVVRPTNGGIVTKRDQHNLSGLKFETYPRPKVYFIHFATAERASVLARVRSAKLSKPMMVTEVTEAQWARRFKDKETIEGSGIAATAKQLEDSFIVGG